MTSIKTVIRKKPLADGRFPVYIRVTKNRQSKYFKTIFSVRPNQWNSSEGCFNSKHENYLQQNRLLLKFKDKALEVLTELKLQQEGFTLDDFEFKYRVKSNPASQKVFPFWEELVQEMIESGRMGNARYYKNVKNSVFKFTRFNRRFSFQDLDPRFLNKYEVYLRSEGWRDNGIVVYMRGIRAMYNKAIERGWVKESFYPFKAYKLSKFKVHTRKRALSMEEVNKIVNMNLEAYPDLTLARHLFVFSFYTRGMNFADMMKLRWDDIRNEKIYYIRSKTKGHFTIQIIEPVRAILNYFKEDNSGTGYVFPILLKDDLTPVQIEDRKHKMMRRYNRDLKEIAKVCGIDKKVTSYVARHSFANCLKQKGVATDIISESLGHQNLSVTQAYLKELDSSKIDQAVLQLL